MTTIDSPSSDAGPGAEADHQPARGPHWFIAVYLALQLLAPAVYYLRSDDPYDERFAWRMFSPERSARCRVSLEVGESPVPLRGTFHEAWLGLAARGRLDVVDAMVERTCIEADDRPVAVRVDCLDYGEPRTELVRDDADACRPETAP